jgi:hypothetical protein
MDKDDLVLESLISSAEELISVVTEQYVNIWQTQPGRANSQVLNGLSSLIKTTSELIKMKQEKAKNEKIIKKAKELQDIESKAELMKLIQ